MFIRLLAALCLLGYTVLLHIHHSLLASSLFQGDSLEFNLIHVQLSHFAADLLLQSLALLPQLQHSDFEFMD